MSPKDEKDRIIVVEDDQSIAELIRYNLETEGYWVQCCDSSTELSSCLEEYQEPVALFILDIMLPGQDGLTICADLKQDSRYQLSSFLFLTALSSERDKLEGFKVGADDFITKPFGMRELLARVRVLVKRYRERVQLLGKASFVGETIETEPKLNPAVEVGLIKLDDGRHRVFCKGKEVEVTNREYNLLRFLMVNRGLAFSRDDLLSHVWGYEYAGETRTVDVHIRQLRSKLEDNPSEPVYIQTVRGVGYRFNDLKGSSQALKIEDQKLEDT